MSTRIWAGMLIGMATCAAYAGGVVILDDVEWRQLTETTNCTWNEVAAACPQDATPCSGSVVRASDASTVDVNGWTWARNLDVQSVFDRIIQPGTTNFPNEFSSYAVVNDPDIAQAVSGPPCWFQPTVTVPYYQGFRRLLYGWPATSYNTNSAYVPYMIDTIAGETDAASLQTIDGKANRLYQGSVPRGVWLYRALQGPTRTRMALALPDINADGTADIAVIRDQPIRAEIRSGADNALLNTVAFLEAFGGTVMNPVDAEVVPDSDGNGVPEIALLVRRYSDARGMVELRNVTGAPGPRQIWGTACQKPLALAVIADDADGNGVPELAVLMTRNRDGRGVVEVKNAYGPTNPVAIWSMSGYTPSDVEIVPDADGNGVPEVAVLETRDSDGRIVVEIKNASGPTNPHLVWFMAGNTAIDLTVVPDADSNTVPEVAVLSSRDADGRIVVETKNAAGATTNSFYAPYARWFAAGHTGLAVKTVPDADHSGIPEVAVLSTRDSDGRILVEMKNAVGVIVNAWSRWYPAGFMPSDLLVLDDLDANGFEELAVLLVRTSDGRILVQTQNAVGDPVKRDYWFSP
jgi:hypothetical protein